MRVLVSFPGRYGDMLWALPAVRALSRRLGHPVALALSAKYGGLAPLLRQQPYLEDVWVLPSWEVQETAPMTPRVPPGVITGADPDEETYDLTLHLGYRGWPARPLPFETLDCLNAQLPQFPSELELSVAIPERELALDEPWITAPAPYPPEEVVVGFSDEHFELKVGLVDLLSHHVNLTVCLPPGSRWQTEWRFDDGPGMDWLDCAALLQSGPVFFGCCSALHVLAVALGKPCVIMEPAPARHADIFYPLGTTGRVRLVLGGDGKPTWDARHCRETIEGVLRASLSR